jgi:hypothetical protein
MHLSVNDQNCFQYGSSLFLLKVSISVTSGTSGEKFVGGQDQSVQVVKIDFRSLLTSS